MEGSEAVVESAGHGSNGDGEAAGRGCVREAWSRWTRVGNTGLVLNAKGDFTIVDLARVNGKTFRVGSTAYAVEPEGRRLLCKRIQKGWVTVYVEGDPEPVTEREPRGYDAGALGRLTGGYLPFILGEAMKGGGFELKPWMGLALVAMAALGVGGWVFYQRYGGA